MKWIILFKGGVETQEFFSMEMSKTFEQYGYQIYWYDLMLQEESATLLKKFVSQHAADEIRAFTFNFNGIAGEPGLYENEVSFWNQTGIPVFNMVVDHPLYYHKYEGFLPKRYWQISIDRNHVKYLNRYCPQIMQPSEPFQPLGGTQISLEGQKIKNYLPLEQRKIDVIFTGNYTPVKQLDHYLCEMDTEYQEYYHGLLEQAISHPDQLIEELAEKSLKSEFEAITDVQIKSCMPNMMYVDLAVRFHYRGEVIKELVNHGIKVHLYGAGWEQLACDHPENMILHGNVNSQKCLDMLGQSKISVNVMPWFKDGAHDRIFNSMLNGAVTVTDGSRYLHEEFYDGKDLRYYELANLQALPGIITDLLKHPDQMERLAANAFNICKNCHTWHQRAVEIVRIMELELE